jgi:hypothetical protein
MTQTADGAIFAPTFLAARGSTREKEQEQRAFHHTNLWSL